MRAGKRCNSGNLFNSLALNGGAPSHCEATLQAFGTSRLRLGYAVDRSLPYVTGGMAWGYLHGKEGDTAINGVNGSGA